MTSPDVYSASALPPQFMPALEDYLAQRRWYTGKGHHPRLADARSTTALPLAATPPGSDTVAIRHLVVVDTAAAPPVTYQIPVTIRAEEAPELAGALIARTDTGIYYDAVYDPVFAPAVLAAMGSGEQVVSSTVLTAEQSNTSLRVRCESGREVMIKLFRVLNVGENPDVVIQAALHQAGPEACASIPQPEGFLAGGWSAGQGHLAVAQQFLAGASEGWELALAAGQAGEDFSASAYALGEATARVHRALAQALPTADPTPEQRHQLLEVWQRRLDEAVAAVPELCDIAPRVHALFDRAMHASWPQLQRIHGDYHLGQVMYAPERGWVLLDFEGEPLRPLAERHQPDLAERDIAGMVRSFDYAAHTAGASPQWRQACEEQFLAGYTAAGGQLPDPDLLAALIADKALYEVVYEAHNRPDWVSIPLTGIARLWEAETMEPCHVDHDILAAIARGLHHNPHSVLGAHESEGAITIRTLRHLADAVAIVTTEGTYPAHHECDGIWVAVLPGEKVPDYRVRVTYGEETSTVDDPYRFWPTFGDLDGHLLAAGRHEDLWRVLGAHVRTFPSELGDVTGVSFSVWAPNARAVRIKGDFNNWDSTAHAMRSLGSSGVWELFVPEAQAGQCYKFEIWGADGAWFDKADPMARGTQVPPDTASVIVDSNYTWNDDDWMTQRAQVDPHSGPMSIYEVHLGSWRQGLHYRALAHELTEYVVSLGFTHVEFMPVAEHPFGGSWGYQVTSYYAPTSRLGSPDDFKYLVDCLHQAGIGVIMDWVPAHFPKDDWALARFDGTPLYEDPDPLRGEHPDWGTLVFNFGRNEVRNFLVANALYWLEEFHIDGLRVDAVASMLYLDYSRPDGQWRPNQYGGRENLEAIQFLQEANATAYRRCPGIVMIAEESTAWPGVTTPTDGGGLGFGLKWNMGWMNDTLRYMGEEPINRRYHHGMLTFSLVYAFSEQFILPFSHDEVVHGKGSLKRKMPGDWWQQLAGVRALLAYQWAHPGKQLLFMGQEFAQDSEWSEANSLDWWLLDNATHAGVAELVRTMNDIYRENPALWSEDFSHRGFEWIQADDADNNVLTFLRRSHDGTDQVVCVVNFAGVPHEGYRIGLPRGGRWKEVLNTDADIYGGSGVGNLGEVQAEDLPWDGREYSVRLRVPPLGALWLTPAED